MVDVMLVLLIIFMVVTPALLAGFNADPPQAQNIKDHPEDEQNDQVLGIDRDGNYYLNKKPVTRDAIPGLLKHIYVDTPREDYNLYLKADKDLQYAKVIDAMDVAAHNGVKVVALISDQRPGTSSSIPGDQKSSGTATPAAPPGGGSK
jgi:biopolymer transport protein ExbD